MRIAAWWQRLTGAAAAIPPAPADMLGAATLVKENTPKLSPDTRGGPIPEKAIALIAKWEGFRERAYQCDADVWTIGYGTTRWPDGRKVKEGDIISRQVAETLLRQQAAAFAADVDRLVMVPLRANERAALISFTYNFGAPALARSTLLRMLNANDRAGAAYQFLRWNKIKGEVSQGLVNRREEEAALFMVGG